MEFHQGITAYAYCMIAELVGGKKVKIENTDYTTSGCTMDFFFFFCTMDILKKGAREHVTQCLLKSADLEVGLYGAMDQQSSS